MKFWLENLRGGDWETYTQIRGNIKRDHIEIGFENLI
jgi:hypothetical protein